MLLCNVMEVKSSCKEEDAAWNLVCTRLVGPASQAKLSNKIKLGKGDMGRSRARAAFAFFQIRRIYKSF